jgi:aminocarboxymuconate-semialdehyde decarboxylase
MPVIDVHNHVVPSDFPVSPSACCAERWPSTETRPDGKTSVVIGGKVFRVIDSRCWDAARRAGDMDGERIDMQVLSPMPELLSYWIDSEPARVMARHVNGAIAAMVASNPERFVGLGMVPLQDPQLAAKELSSFKSEFNLIGVEIGSNILGRPPGDPMFDPFFAEAERLDMPIFVHALHPTGMDRLVGPPRLATFLNFPVDTGFAVASMITGRTLEKFPRLRVAFSHGGGTFAMMLPRLDAGWRNDAEVKALCASPVETARRFYYDNLVFDVATMRHLCTVFGKSQIFVGTDYPFGAGQKDPLALVEALGFSEEDIDLIRGDNAARFLGLEPAG